MSNYIPRRKVKFSVAIPTSILYTEPGLREKTLKITQIIRCLVIYRVDELIIYYDRTIGTREHRELARLITKIYRYYTMPPYLRRRLIPLDKDLRYVGAAPPLRHTLFDVERIPSLGEYRLAYVESVKDKYALVDAGLSKSLHTTCIDECPGEGEIVPIRIVSLDPIRAEYSKELHEKIYTVPSLKIVDELDGLIESYRNKRSYILSTSRYGKVIDLQILDSLCREIARRGCVLILFGGPRYGLYDIAKLYNMDLDRVSDIVLNVIPLQGTKTVRTEEAMHAILSMLNIVLR